MPYVRFRGKIPTGMCVPRAFQKGFHPVDALYNDLSENTSDV